MPQGSEMVADDMPADTSKVEDESYFSADAGWMTRGIYVVLALGTIVYSMISILAPLITPTCTTADTELPPVKHPNPDYVHDPCRFVHYAILGGLNKWEADTCVRILVSILCGSIIGFERRRPDRPAGVRTMALVCLGSCVFTVDSMWAFIDGPMAWDASRVSAAIPSGVGFLGAATIWKGTSSKPTADSSIPAAPEVHGLTTATSVWLSAAIGILAGGALYAPALFTTAASVVYLRFAPRMPKIDASHSGSSANGDTTPNQGNSFLSLSMSNLEALRQPLMAAGSSSADQAPADAGGTPPKPVASGAPSQAPALTRDGTGLSGRSGHGAPSPIRRESTGSLRSPSAKPTSASRAPPSLNI